jgi:hypothetical protein
MPSNWGMLDAYQEFEMVELDMSGDEVLKVSRKFHSTLPNSAVKIRRVFRVQNPRLWDKYCT